MTGGERILRFREDAKQERITMNSTFFDVESTVRTILMDYGNGRNIDNLNEKHDLPNKDVVHQIINSLMKIIYPGFYRGLDYKSYTPQIHIATLIEDVIYRLNKQIAKVWKYTEGGEDLSYEERFRIAGEITLNFMNRIPLVREYLETDLKAAYEGDPAALNYDEILLSFPGLYAITVNRLAHELFLLKVPMIPRIMTEYAHSQTGIDIHPGASIGKYFFIDHGTGIVIGETTVIGSNVKIYQGVTLGALSLRGGHSLQGTKRHPTIEDYVTIYSGASVLGGETVIGRGSVIGGNCFVTRSVPPETRVYIRQQELPADSENNSIEE